MSAPLRREVRPIESRGEWLSWRRQDVTASSLAALFECHPFMSIHQLAASMRGQSQGSTPAMRRGRILEPAVIAALSEDHPDWIITRATSYHRLTDYRIGATPDAWLDNDGLIECKTVSPAKWDEWHGAPPLAYTLQLLAGLMCTGRTRGVLAIMVCSPSYPVHEFLVERHPAAEQRILDTVAAFWGAWDIGEIPAPAPADDITALLDDGSHKDLSSDNAIRDLLAERAELKATVSAAEKRLGTVDYEIKNRIGPARTAYVPGWNLSFKSQQRKEAVIPAAQIRVLRVKATAEEIE